MGINRAIARLAMLFCGAFAILALRQLWFAAVAAPGLSGDPHNPRVALLAPYRGSIVARDGTVLAASSARGRVYPLGPALAQTVGYASPRYGASGLEAAFDRQLSGAAVASDPMAQLERIVRHRSAFAVRGATVVTTLDPRVQTALFDALSMHARGAGVALDPRTGEVLAIASVPSFDPGSLEKSFSAIRADPQSPLLDRALDGLYPPGSTFKVVTAADALESGAVAMTDTFYDPGSFQVGAFQVHDDESEATGTQDLTGAFALSSNVDFAQIALKLGASRWFDYAAKWDLGKSPEFELPVAPDHLPSPASVTPSILAQLGFGQADLLVTPLRMALVAATIAAGGNEPRPFLVRSVRTPGSGDVPVGSPSTLATPISGDTAAAVRSLMIAVVQRGTGTSAAIDDVQVAGKTGTATNPAGRSHAWFVAFAPAEAPRVAVAIVVENVGYGAAYAAPIARKVIVAALSRGSS